MEMMFYCCKIRKKHRTCFFFNFFFSFAPINFDTIEKEEKVQYWIDIANEDLAVAEDMHKTKHWLYVAFMCHQIIEKMLKAYWTATSDLLSAENAENVNP